MSIRDHIAAAKSKAEDKAKLDSFKSDLEIARDGDIVQPALSLGDRAAIARDARASRSSG